MPFFSRRILVSLCPFVNLDLFKKGFYHISVRLVDQNADQTLSRVECLRVEDMLGPELTQFTYPGACSLGDHFITQTSLVEYTEQAFPLGECFLFKLDSPILSDHTDAYLPSSLAVYLELRFSGDEELPKDPSMFVTVSSRVVEFSVDWRKGLHDHFPVLFDYFHMAAVGVTLHASLLELCLEQFTASGSQSRLPQRRRSIRSASGRRWSIQSQPSVSSLPSLHTILFGTRSSTLPPPPSTSHPLRSFSLPSDPQATRSLRYVVPERQIERAQEAHQMLCDVLCSARDSLQAACHVMCCEDMTMEPAPEAGDMSKLHTLEEAESLCTDQVNQLNTSLSAAWVWFCQKVVSQLEVTSHLAASSHYLHMQYAQETLASHEHPFFKTSSHITDPSSLSVVASRIRKGLAIPMLMYCKENVETALNSSVIFVEPPPWPVLEEGSIPLAGEATSLDSLPGTAPGLRGFTRYLRPYLMDSLPRSGGRGGRRSAGIHLVVCVHGLQGNQFDLRLYRIFLSLALPQIRFSFLMASANQTDTFCDFNLMTDRLLEEVLDHVRDMPTPPSRVSFIGHSLGGIVIRSLVTRPEFAPLHPKLHLFLSICGPHLGTKYQTGIVSVGMWAVRKWYNSKSLLQLSLKDAPNPADSFLYHLSEAPSLESFRHVVLLASPQDKYVPYHSAKIATLSRDAAFQSSISLRIMQNILEPLRKARVNLVRISVDHAIPTSANSVIGRAAHIAMLDNELFIRKLVTLHLAQYFVES